MLRIQATVFKFQKEFYLLCCSPLLILNSWIFSTYGTALVCDHFPGTEKKIYILELGLSTLGLEIHGHLGVGPGEGRF